MRVNNFKVKTENENFEIILRLTQATKLITTGGLSSLEFCRKFKLPEETTEEISVSSSAILTKVDEAVAKTFDDVFENTNRGSFEIDINLLKPGELRKIDENWPSSFIVGLEYLSKDRIIELAKYSHIKRLIREQTNVCKKQTCHK